MTEHEELILELRRGFTGLREEVTGLRGEVRKTNERLDEMNEKIDTGFKEISGKFDGLGRYLIAMDRHVDNHESRISELEKNTES